MGNRLPIIGKRQVLSKSKTRIAAGSQLLVALLTCHFFIPSHKLKSSRSWKRCISRLKPTSPFYHLMHRCLSGSFFRELFSKEWLRRFGIVCWIGVWNWRSEELREKIWHSMSTKKRLHGARFSIFNTSLGFSVTLLTPTLTYTTTAPFIRN